MPQALVGLRVLTLAASAAAGTASRVEVAASACPSRIASAHWAEDGLRLQLAAQTDYVGWLQEAGVDVERVTGDGRRIDSRPERWAREPLWLHSDAEGRAALLLQRLSQQRAGSVRLQLYCVAGLSQAQQSQWRHLRGFAEARADIRTASRPSTPLRLAGHALALLTSEELGAPERLWLQLQLGKLSADAGHAGTAGDWYRLASASAERGGMPEQAALARLGYAQTLLARRDAGADAALRASETALNALGLTQSAAVAAHDRCLLQRMRGETAGAAACLAVSARRFAELAEPRDEGNARRNRATALLLLGRYREAGEELRRALQLAERAGSTRQRSLASRLQAQLRTWAGDFEQALALLHDALSEREAAGDALEAANLRRLVAATYALAGEPVRAIAQYRAVLEFYRQRQMRGRVADVGLRLAALLRTQGRSLEAAELLHQARAGLDPKTAAVPWAEASLRLADELLTQRRGVEAEALLRELGRSGVELPWQLQADRALLQLRLHPDASEAAAQLTPLRDRAQAGGHLLLQLALDQALIELALVRGDSSQALAIAEQALAVGYAAARRLRSPGLRHALLERLREPARLRLRLLSAGPLSATAAEQALAGFEHLRQLEQASSPALADDEVLTELERRVGSELLAEGERAASPEREQLLLDWHRLEARARPAIASVLPSPKFGRPSAGEVWLYVVAGRHDGGVLLADTEGWRWRPGLDVAALRQVAANLRERLAEAHGGRDAIAAQVEQLAQLLAWPELLTRAPQRLAIIADAEFVGLPWPLLPAPAAPQRLLLEDSELVLWQSLQPAERSVPTQLQTLAASPGPGLALAALPQAEHEAAAVAELWSGRFAHHRAAADRASLRAALAAPSALVHIASHGRGDRGRSEESGLWLHGGRAQTPDFVSVLRLRHWPVHSALVVLSACDSGYSGVASRFGVGGVAGSLVDAGAGAVLASRWPVSDRAAQAFALAFHRALAAQPRAPAGALRAAQLSLRRQPVWRHPRHWAGWFLLQAGPAARSRPARAERR